MARPPAARPQASPCCLCLTQKHNVSEEKRAKNQKCHETGRRATVLTFPGMGKHPTGLPEPLGLFPAPKTGKQIIVGPPLGALGPLLGAALKGMLHWSLQPL